MLAKVTAMVAAAAQAMPATLISCTAAAAVLIPPVSALDCAALLAGTR
jgi:hypothetical protein